jgi:putative OPT family oligopeptide transporter
MIVATFKDSVRHYAAAGGEDSDGRTDRDIPTKAVGIVILVVILAIAFTPIVPVGLFGALLIAVFGFFFASVSSRIVGILGSSNSPVSGMTLATLIVTACLFKLTGNDGASGMLATIAVGGVIGVVTAIAGDTSQDLKTGYLLGATPSKQQIGELIGVAASALAIGGILTLLNTAWGFGSSEIPAPQATLMKLVIEGVMGGNLPWPLVLSGAAVGLSLALLRLPILPVAIGLYLPLHLSTPLIVGGLIRYALDRGKDGAAGGDSLAAENGVLFSSGLIAGEGFVGITLAVFAVAGVNVSLSDGPVFGSLAACAAFAFLSLCLAKVVFTKERGL